MQQMVSAPISSSSHPVGTKGFLNPEIVADMFGIKEGMMIADFGCGSGYFTIYLARKTGETGKVYAFDVVESAIDNIRAKARVENLGNIETIRANLEVSGSSGLPDKSQDLVLMANILFQSSKREEIIREASRILKDGGQMIVIDWKKGTGGFGPPEDIRISEDDIEAIAQRQKLMFERQIDTGQFHFGLIFNKS